MRIRGPVWPLCPQTPQGAECHVFCAAVGFIAGQSTVHSDCLNVVRYAELPWEQARPVTRDHMLAVPNLSVRTSHT
eukprot:2628362-Pyramimonas_sp.AAC.1